MIFNSVTFLLFLVAIVALYWTLPRRPRLALVFLGSLTFYGFWQVPYVLVMLASTVTDYVAARRIESSRTPARRKAWLLASLAVNLGLLFYFKYLLFFTDNVWWIFEVFGAESTPPVLDIVLPLGISFYTFQTISYTVDVYRGFVPAEKDFVLYGCYVTFFPQLVAGPIERFSNLFPQLTLPRKVRIDFIR